jgi:hypothetical protein
MMFGSFLELILRPSIDKRNYVEKVDQDFAPYQCVEQFPDFEKELSG